MEFVEIFTQMNWIAAVLLIVGCVFFIVEIFLPGFGFFGITGLLSMVAGVVVRICYGLNLVQSLTLILLVVGAVGLCFMLMTFSAKYGILGKSGLFETKSSLPTNYNDVDRQLRKLVGKSGKAISKLDLGGQAKIRGKIYNVMSISSYIEAGSNIKVVEIKNNTIMVRKWFE